MTDKLNCSVKTPSTGVFTPVLGVFLVHSVFLVRGVFYHLYFPTAINIDSCCLCLSRSNLFT